MQDLLGVIQMIKNGSNFLSSYSWRIYMSDMQMSRVRQCLRADYTAFFAKIARGYLSAIVRLSGRICLVVVQFLLQVACVCPQVRKTHHAPVMVTMFLKN